MDNSIYIALSKQIGTEKQMAVIANNLANANTTGYKADGMVFEQFLNRDVLQKDAYSNSNGTYRNTSQGRMEVTSNPLDFAIEGQGYFMVKTSQGNFLTRSGNFMIDSEGTLVTPEGYKVLDNSQAEIQFEEDDLKVVVYGDGRMEVDGEERTNLGVFQIRNEQKLEKVGSNLYLANETPTENEGEAMVAQGMIERSNVEPVIELTNMIEVQRDFNNTTKYINGLYELQETAIRTIARVA